MGTLLLNKNVLDLSLMARGEDVVFCYKKSGEVGCTIYLSAVAIEWQL